jgi:hypothetical protein
MRYLYKLGMKITHIMHLVICSVTSFVSGLYFLNWWKEIESTWQKCWRCTVMLYHFPSVFWTNRKTLKRFWPKYYLLWDDVLTTVLIFWDKNWPCHRDDLIYIGKHSIVWNYNVWSLDITCTIDFYKTDKNHAPWFNIGTPQGMNHVPWMMS